MQWSDVYVATWKKLKCPDVCPQDTRQIHQDLFREEKLPQGKSWHTIYWDGDKRWKAECVLRTVVIMIKGLWSWPAGFFFFFPYWDLFSFVLFMARRRLVWSAEGQIQALFLIPLVLIPMVCIWPFSSINFFFFFSLKCLAWYNEDSV